MCKEYRLLFRRAGHLVRHRPGATAFSKRRRNSQAGEIAMLAKALQELAEIRSTAEQAADNILASAEDLLTDDAGHAQDDAVMNIMTACGFHDLVGQRAEKVSQTIDRILASRVRRAERAQKQCGAQRQKRPNKTVANGPGLSCASPSQARIDALFAKA